MQTEMINYNSTKNQKIKGEFVGREIFANVNDLVEFVLKNPEAEDVPFTMDDIQNMFVYPEFFGKHAKFSGGTEDERDEEIENLREMLENINPNMDEDQKEILETEIEDEISELENLETKPQEIFEWWFVSPFLANKLEEIGEPIIRNGPDAFWGRTCTGQAILLDGTISKICEDLEILEGQQNER